MFIVELMDSVINVIFLKRESIIMIKSNFFLFFPFFDPFLDSSRCSRALLIFRQCTRARVCVCLPINFRAANRTTRAVSLRSERSLSRGFPSLDLDTVLEERSDQEQTQVNH